MIPSESTYRPILTASMETEGWRVGWVYEEVWDLALRPDAPRDQGVDAEVHREPVFGLGPGREKVVVRIRLPVQHDWALAFARSATEGVTLYEAGRPFGQENGWRLYHAALDEDTGVVDIWLHDGVETCPASVARRPPTPSA